MSELGISGEFDPKRRSGEIAYYTKWSGIHSAMFRLPDALPIEKGHSTVTNIPEKFNSSQTIKVLMPDPDILQDEILANVPRAKVHNHEFPVLGGIHLLTKIGQGGMGAVFYGIHPRLGQPVAVKVLHGYLAKRDPTFVKRFIREARLAFSVQSPHLIRVIDINEENNLFYIVMEYVAGQTAYSYLLQTRMHATQGLPEHIALSICIGATKGLEAAHQNDVIHRDIKPDNVLIPYATRSKKPNSRLVFEQTKLVDLGLARKEMRDKTAARSNFSLGTPQFMAPEQGIDASAVGKPADVFGLGATLYMLLSGEPPVKDGTQKHAFVSMAKYQSILKVRPDVSDGTAELIDRCLQTRPELRPADATELLSELKAIVRAMALPAESMRSGEWVS